MGSAYNHRFNWILPCISSGLRHVNCSDELLLLHLAPAKNEINYMLGWLLKPVPFVPAPFFEADELDYRISRITAP